MPVIFFGYFGTFTLIVLSSNHTIREFALNDKYSKVVNNRYIEYSGIYFQNLGEKPMLFTLNREKMPEEIYIGKFVFEGAEHTKITPVKIRKIYDRGKFIGPSVSEEMSIGY